MIAPGEPLIKVDAGLSAGAVVDKEFLGAGSPGETPDRTAGQAQLPGGLRASASSVSALPGQRPGPVQRVAGAVRLEAAPP